MQAGAHRHEFLAVNPMVQQLSMRISSYENPAQFCFTCAKYDNMPTSLEQQAEISQWFLFANATWAGNFVEASRGRSATC